VRCNCLQKRNINFTCIKKDTPVLFASLLNNWKSFLNQMFGQNPVHSQSFSLFSPIYKNLFFQECNKSLINFACSGPYWENIGPRSFLHGPRCARSVLSRPRADVLPVRPSRLVNKIYVLDTTGLVPYNVFLCPGASKEISFSTCM